MKNKKAASATGFIAGIVSVLIGVVMIPVITSLTEDAQTISSNEQILSTTSNASVTLAYDDLVSGSEVINTSNIVVSYSINYESGVINFWNGTGVWNVSYDYEPDGYVNSAAGRTVTRQIAIIFAVGLILAGIAVAGLSLRE